MQNKEEDKKLENMFRCVWNPAKDILYSKLQEFSDSINIIPNEESRRKVFEKIEEIKNIVRFF